jgi:hypothetical protein
MFQDFLHVRAELPDHGPLLARRQRDIDIVLVRTEILVGHEFRHGYLGVDGTAQFLVALPFLRIHVEGRRGGEPDDSHLLDRAHDRVECLPPFAPEMMTLVQNHRRDIGPLEQVRHIDFRRLSAGRPFSADPEGCVIGCLARVRFILRVPGFKTGDGHVKRLIRNRGDDARMPDVR